MSASKKHGVVVLLDALGVSSYDMAAAEVFFKKREAIFQGVEIAFSGFHDEGIKIGLPPNVLKMFPKRSSQATFGDTVLFEWEFAVNDFANCILGIGLWLNLFIHIGLKEGLAFRGAISVGDYIVDYNTSTYLGPAVADAASWYEKANWIGIIVTPSMGLRLEILASGKLKGFLSKAFVKYPNTPLKNSQLTEAWVAAWPVILYEEKTRTGKNLPRNEIISTLGQFPIPKGTESKYYNTINFFDWYIGVHGGK